MKYYIIINPLGCILTFVKSYSIANMEDRKMSMIEWFNNQSPSISIEAKEGIYNKYSSSFNLDINLLDNLFIDLGWATYYYEMHLDNSMK